MKRETVMAAVAVETVAMAGAVSYHLGSKSLAVDEGFSVAMARLPATQFWHVVSTREANQSLYYLLLRGTIHTGSTESWLRVVPALAAIATVPALYALGRRLFTDRVGLLAGLLLCLNGFFVWFGQFSRGYTLVVALVTVSSLCLVRALDRATRGRWVLWGAVSGVACYVHFFALLVIGAQLVSLRFRSREGLPRRELSIGLGMLAVLLAPLAVFVAVVPGDQVDFIAPPDVHLFFHVLTSLAGHGGPALLLVLGGFCAVALGVLVQRWRGPDRSAAVWPLVLAWSWLVVPIVVAFGVSLVKPIVQDAFLLVCLPALLLLAAVGIDRVVDVAPRAAVAVALAAVLVLGCRSVANAYRHVDEENWRAATALVLSESRPGDGLLFVTSDERAPFEYYDSRMSYPARAPTPLYPGDSYRHLVPRSVQTPSYDRATLDRLLAGRLRVWVLQRAVNGDVGAPRYRLPRARGVRIERHTFTDVDVSLYAVRQARR
jgi:mannosyltransferase